ncbi:poly(R)-hydroxyalkanoic acid synthase subunit [Natronomonas sp. F2-12]|jgi:DNA repair ATPase RecN|uniref:Poly(3-hydroxyalkanoate) polymerase subunit PhaE n=1 Tax=Natronomonas aquatica TaxID=2841590 RepID=A0A9R1D6T1_9EURY|nr:poly(R)-hydroxyalkanoic acid synthase subunit PhaE [Natronomonas aquatica]MCQ4333532.1 poly(R)-hydroxyalkanoic acid synthase subunit [Natronomonas aquatica]
MADGSDPDRTPEQWNEIVARMNERMVEGMEASTEAQAEFVESWVDAFDAFESINEEQFSREGSEGNTRAHSVWMEAAEETAEKMAAAARGGEIDPEEVRDLWLDSANEAFKEVISTDAFSSMTGRSVEDALDVRETVDESAQATLREFGFATERDVREVGERLVELERRQKKLQRELGRLEDVETKLDRVLEHLEEPA